MKTATKQTVPAFQPLGDRILVRRKVAENTTPGGIHLPDSVSEKPREGTVVTLGTGKRTEDGAPIPFRVKVGDRVIFSAYGGNEHKALGDDLVIMSEADIFGILS